MLEGETASRVHVCHKNIDFCIDSDVAQRVRQMRIRDAVVASRLEEEWAKSSDYLAISRV